jgi:hypothetical protein
MPTIALQGALRTPVRPGPAHGTLAGGPGHGVMTAAQELAPVRPESPATVGPMPAESPPSIALATRRALAARERGLHEREDTTGGTRYRDIMPELMIELI